MIQKISRSLNIDKEVVEEVWKLYWKFIKDSLGEASKDIRIKKLGIFKLNKEKYAKYKEDKASI